MRKRFLISRKIIGAVLILATVGSNFTARAQTAANERMETFEEVWKTVNEKYYDTNFNGVNWKAVRRKYLARLKKVSGEKEFYALLDRMVGELRDAHTRVYSPVQREQQIRQRRTSVGIVIGKIEGKPVIVNVAPDSEAARARVKAGMIIRKISGRKIDEALAEARRETGASSSERSTAMRVYSKILAGEPETILRLELLDEGGKIFNVNLKRETLASKPIVEARLLNSGIAYLKFSGFEESLEQEIRENLTQFKNAPALILDLRSNPGGDGEMGLRFAGNFFSETVTAANLVTRDGKPPIPGMPMTLQIVGKDSQIYSHPVAVLINEATASTAELITNAMQEQNRAVVFGTPSCGCVLAFLDYKKLKGGGFLTMSEFGFITPKNRRLEGEGVTPDKIVAPTLGDLRNERDAALLRAEQYLKNLLQPSK